MMRTSIVAFVAGAVIATSMVGAIAPATAVAPTAAVPGAAAVTADRAASAEAETVGPLATVSGSGTAFPAGPVEVAVMPDGGVSSGVRPFLAVPRLMGESSDIAVRVVDASLPGAPVQWSGRLKDGWGRVDATLAPGGAYRVEVSADGVKWDPAGWLVVRGAWAAGGSDVGVSALTVSPVSGGASWGWQSGALPGPVGMGSVSLGWSSGWAVPASLRAALPAGLPVGWRLGVGSGSPWASILVSEQDGIARVVGWDGSVLVFQRNGSGVWVQVTGGAPGFSNELNKVDAGTWEFVSAEGATTRFSGDKGAFRSSKVFAGGNQLSTVVWDTQQRVSSVTNEVGRTVRLTYNDSANACASSRWAGWTTAPSGMLCRLTYPDGTSTDLGYVPGVAGAAQIGMVKDPGNAAATLGWDSRGRLVAERGVFANRVAAVDSAAKRAVTALTYDSTGRATTLTLATGAIERLAFPQVDEQVLKAWVADRDKAQASSPVTVKSSLVAKGFELAKTSWVDPTSWVTLRAQDSSGAQVRLVTDERGRVGRQIDALGRVTTYSYNDLGLVTGTTGPSTDSKAPQTSQDFDTRTQGGRQVDLVGLRALVGAGANRVPEYWAATTDKGGVSYSWSGRPSGWAGQATGVWDPSKADRDAADAAGGWSFQVKSEGADVTFRVGGRVCQPDQSGTCDMGRLPSGLAQITVEIDRGQPRGFFQVLSGPRGGKLVEIPGAAVTPGYGLQTEQATNDTFPGRSQQPRTTSAFSDPASGQPSQVTAPGGLVSRYAYEPTGWERLAQVTTAGGATQKTTYWPDNGTVAVPGVCGGATVQVSGQVKSVTRQDGTVVTSWPDLSDRIVATEVRGRKGATQTTCTEYFVDGTVKAVRTFGAEGQLAESVVNEPAINGDYRISKSTVTKGSGAAPLKEVWSQTRLNVLGQAVEATGSSSVTTATTYNSLSLPATVTTKASGGTTLTTAYSYRARDAQISAVTVNGVRAASVEYDSLGRMSSVTYPDGAIAAFTYDTSGRAYRQTLRSGGQTWTHELNRTAFGRVLGATLVRGGAADEQREYTYDPGTGRLTQATVRSGASGTTATERYGYTFSMQDAACPKTSYNPAADGLRSGGSRNGMDYVSCHDDSGRLISTTDPQVTGGKGAAAIGHDDFGRVTAIGGVAPVTITWGADGSMARLDQGGDDTAVITTQDFAGETVLRTVVNEGGTQSVRYAGPFTLSANAEGDPGPVIATQYSLPGGVQVSVQGGVATATIPDLDGSAMATISIPALAGGTGANGALVPADRFGPYGEPLTAPAGGSAVKDYTWRAGAGLETLPGSASITMMGARAYHPGLGEFLTPDPLLDGGDALYAYTSGDPINFRDPTGGSEQPEWAKWLALIGGGIMAVVAGGAAIKAGTASTIGGAKAAAWISGIAGAAAVAGGAYLAATSNADSDTALFAAGIAIAAVGGVSAAAGIYRGVKKVGRLREAAAPGAVRDSGWDRAQQELAEQIRAEAAKMQQAKTQLVEAPSQSASMPDWASSMSETGGPPSKFLTTAPPGQMTLGEINSLRVASAGDGMAWSFDKVTQTMSPMSQSEFGMAQLMGRVEGRYNNVIVLKGLG
jgi:RHS repeat-associated protein